MLRGAYDNIHIELFFISSSYIKKCQHKGHFKSCRGANIFDLLGVITRLNNTSSRKGHLQKDRSLQDTSPHVYAY